MLSFGPFVVDAAEGRLLREGREVAIQPAAFRLLAWLAERPDRLVRREEILREVWAGVHVSDHALTQMLRRVRVALDDDVETPRYLETVPRLGYRFRGPVHGVPTPARPSAPGPSAALIGRDALLAHLVSLASEGRPVALVGPAGVGKTALLREVVPRAGLVLDLAPSRTVEEAIDAARTSLAVPPRADLDGRIDAVGRALAARGRVGLDNLEQLPDAAWDVVRRWSALGASLVATTRRAPPAGADVAVVVVPTLDADAGVALYENRARAVGGVPRGDVRALVDRLDGLPLAIELAASRAALLGADEMRARLDKRFQLLRRQGAGQERHGALSTAIRGSWDLLTDRERDALASVAVYAGAFSLDDAEAVVGPWAMDALEGLAAASMVQIDASPGGTRFRLLESIRELVRELSPAWNEGESRSALVARWSAHVLDVAEPLAAEADSQPTAATLVALRARLPDLLAIAAARERDAPDVAARAALAAWSALYQQRPPDAVLPTVDRLLATPGVSARVRANLYLCRAMTRRRHLDAAGAIADLDAALAEVGDADARMAFTAARMRAAALRFVGRTDQATSILRRLADEAEARGDRWALARACLDLAAQFPIAAAEFLAVTERGLAAAIAGGDTWARAGHLTNRGSAMDAAGRPEDAAIDLEDALRVWIALGQRDQELVARQNLANLYIESGRPAEGAAALLEVVAGAREVGDVTQERNARSNLVVALLYQGRFEEAIDAAKTLRADSAGAGDEEPRAHAEILLGVCLGTAGRPAEAISWVTRAEEAFGRLQRSTRLPQVHVVQALASVELGRDEEAHRALARLVEARDAVPAKFRDGMVGLVRAAVEGGPVPSPPPLPYLRLLAGWVGRIADQRRS